MVLGGIFDGEETEEVIIKNAIKYLNSPNLKFLSKQVSESNVFEAFKTSCIFFQNQAKIILGPGSRESVNAVQELCGNKSIPHIVAQWLYKPNRVNTLINFYPNLDHLQQVYYDFIKLSGWKSFTVFFDNNMNFLQMVDLINLGKKLGIVVSVKKLDHEGNSNYMPNLKKVLLSGETNFVISCQIEILENVLLQAQQIGIMTKHYNYFITNLDFQSINLKSFKHNLANITGLRLFNVKAISNNPIFLSVDQIKTETVLMVDAIQVLNKVFTPYNNITFNTKPINCKSFNTFDNGVEISKKIKETKFIGFTRNLEFDNNGQRKYFHLDIVELHENGFRTIGTWNPIRRLSIVQPKLRSNFGGFDTLRNRSFTVMTYLVS